jgi:hypothetical protein
MPQETADTPENRNPSYQPRSLSQNMCQPRMNGAPSSPPPPGRRDRRPGHFQRPHPRDRHPVLPAPHQQNRQPQQEAQLNRRDARPGPEFTPISGGPNNLTTLSAGESVKQDLAGGHRVLGSGRFLAGISRRYGRTADRQAAFRRMPAAGRCSAVTPPARHVVSLPYELRDAHEPPLRADLVRRLPQVAVAHMGFSVRSGAVRVRHLSSCSATGIPQPMACRVRTDPLGLREDRDSPGRDLQRPVSSVEDGAPDHGVD